MVSSVVCFDFLAMSSEAPPLIDNPDTIPANPHKLWRQIVGFVFWSGVISFVRFNQIRDWLVLILMFLTGCLTFADAWVSGIYKDRSRKSFLNISPMSWAILMSGWTIVGFPVYMIMRNKLRTRNGGVGFFIAIAVLGGIMIYQFVSWGWLVHAD